MWQAQRRARDLQEDLVLAQTARDALQTQLTGRLDQFLGQQTPTAELLATVGENGRLPVMKACSSGCGGVIIADKMTVRVIV